MRLNLKLRQDALNLKLAGILLLREKVTAHNVFGSIMVVVGIFLLFLV